MRIQAQNSQMPGALGQEYFVSLSPTDVTIQAGGRFTVQYSGGDPENDNGLLSIGQRGEGDTEIQSLVLFRLTRFFGRVAALAGADINSWCHEHPRRISDKSMCL